eukprot:1157586-Pelagomonas_calceolata.AAC.6
MLSITLGSERGRAILGGNVELQTKWSGILGHWPRRPAAAACLPIEQQSVYEESGHFEKSGSAAPTCTVKVFLMTDAVGHDSGNKEYNRSCDLLI